MITTKAKLATICDYLVVYLISQAMQNHTKFLTLLQCKMKKKKKSKQKQKKQRHTENREDGNGKMEGAVICPHTSGALKWNEF